MTEREDDPSDKLVAEPPGEPPGEPQWEPDDTWPPGQQWAQWPADEDWEWVEPGLHGAPQPAAPALPPWYRRSGVLVGLIITAMVALVIASVVLLTNARFGESDDVRLRPTIHTSAVSLPSGQQRTSSPATSAAVTSTEPTRSSAPSEEPGPIGGPVPPPPAEPSRGGAVGDLRETPLPPGGPRVNVTRPPMSFTPGGR